MKKIFKFMMMALVATVMSIGFAACSSDDDDDNNNLNIYTRSFENVSLGTETGSDISFKAMQQAETVYNEALGITDGTFKATSDADVKAKAVKAEEKLTNLDWENTSGSFTYVIKNAKSKATVYSKTFSSNAGDNQLPR